MSGVSAVAGTPGETWGAKRKRWGKLLFSRTGAAFGYGLAALLIYYGWVGRDGRTLSAGEGLGYVLGIAGGSMMLLLLLYSARKRVRFLRRFGATRYWFRIHMMLGIVGPVLILYHCNFQVGSLNSQVALLCTLLVAASGIVGRYLYSQIHHGLYGRKNTLQELTESMKRSASLLSRSDGLLDDVRRELAALGEQVLIPPETIAASLLRPISMAFRTRWLYHRLRWQVRRRLIARSLTSPAVAEHRERLLLSTTQFLRRHLRQVRQVAQFGTYERLFSLWHVIHVPFFLMMVVSAVVHVIAVHMY